MTASSGSDLLIVGGGLVGLAAAREAAGLGMRVTVVERGPLGGGASHAAAGMLSPLDDAHRGRVFLEFAVAGFRLYPSWVGELESECGRSVEYRECGKVVAALSAAEKGPLQDTANVALSHGLRAEWIEPGPLSSSVPDLTHEAVGALLVHDDFRVDNRALAAALAVSCRERGVRLCTETDVRALRVASGRTQGLTLRDGTSLDTDRVLLSAGAWSGGIEGLPRALPVRPVRGQMLALRPTSWSSSSVLCSHDVYLVPRDDGRLLVGATVEDVGFEEANTAGGTIGLLSAALALVPSLESAPVVEVWSGLRPASLDGLPILGGDPEVEGLFYATGHFRSGVLLAPITGRVLADLIAGRDSPVLPRELEAARLAGSPGPLTAGR